MTCMRSASDCSVICQATKSQHFAEKAPSFEYGYEQRPDSTRHIQAAGSRNFDKIWTPWALEVFESWGSKQLMAGGMASAWNASL